MVLADIEGAKIHVKQLSLSHQLASWESIQEILIRHYTRQFILEIYKKPERTLFLYVDSEGAIKVLNIIDSTYHNLSDLKSPDVPQLNYKRNHAQKHGNFDHYTERIAIGIPFIGISLMNSFPKELLFACEKRSSSGCHAKFGPAEVCFTNFILKN